MNAFRNLMRRRSSTSEGSSNASDSDLEGILPYRKKSGNLFVGDYKIISELGHGKFATVVLAKIPGKDKQFAIKMVRMKKSRDEHLLTEKHILEYLGENRHKLIVKYYDTFISNNYMCFILEYLGGGSIANHLRCGPLSEERARFYAACMLSGVAHLHSLNIAHKDIKPQNVVLNQNGYAVLVDFGHSQLQIRHSTPLRDRLGTQRYKAPEFFSSRPVYRSSDYWALCVTLYMMLTKKVNVSIGYFQDRNEYVTVLPRIEYDVSNLSNSAKDLFSKVFKKNPVKRLGSGRRGAEELMEHPYFRKIDFDKLSKESLEAPPMRPSRLQLLKNLVLCQCATG